MSNNTYGITVEDLEKAASVRLFEKAAAAEGINLADLSDSQVEELYAAYQSQSEENTMNDEIIDLFEKQGLLQKDGNRLKYIDSKGEEHKEYRKNWDGQLLDMVMSDSLLEKTSEVNTKVDEPVLETEQE